MIPVRLEVGWLRLESRIIRLKWGRLGLNMAALRLKALMEGLESSREGLLDYGLRFGSNDLRQTKSKKYQE